MLTIACPSVGMLLGAAGVVTAVLAAAALTLKALITYLRSGQAPSTWRLLAVTVAEPVAYVLAAWLYVAAAPKIWSIDAGPMVFAALGLLLVYASVAGLHANLLRPDRGVHGQWRYLGWGLAYALVVPALVAGFIVAAPATGHAATGPDEPQSAAEAPELQRTWPEDDESVSPQLDDSDAGRRILYDSGGGLAGGAVGAGLVALPTYAIVSAGRSGGPGSDNFLSGLIVFGVTGATYPAMTGLGVWSGGRLGDGRGSAGAAIGGAYLGAAGGGLALVSLAAILPEVPIPVAVGVPVAGSVTGGVLGYEMTHRGRSLDRSDLASAARNGVWPTVERTRDGEWLLGVRSRF